MQLNDTCCQSCLASMSIVHHLSLSRYDFIPVTDNTYTCSQQKQHQNPWCSHLEVLRQIPTRTATWNGQVVCITNSSKMFLSHEACEDLAMISENFLMMDEVIHTHTHTGQHASMPPDQAAVATTQFPRQCEYPHRQTPLSKQAAPPFAPTQANQEYLEEWLLNYCTTNPAPATSWVGWLWAHWTS